MVNDLKMIKGRFFICTQFHYTGDKGFVCSNCNMHRENIKMKIWEIIPDNEINIGHVLRGNKNLNESTNNKIIDLTMKSIIDTKRFYTESVQWVQQLVHTTQMDFQFKLPNLFYSVDFFSTKHTW